MVSAISSYATDSIVLSGKTRVQKISGKLAGAYTPGQCVYQTATDTWTTTVGTASQNHYRVGWVEFKKRTSSTFGEVDIDTTYSDYTAYDVEIIVGPVNGEVMLAVKCQNLSAAKYFGYPLQCTSGGLLAKHNKVGSAATVATVTEEGYTSGDTVVKIYIGGGGGISIA